MEIHSELVISKADGRPMYLQIMDQIKRRIAVGDWPAGMDLPSIRQLAVALKVSVITVKRAYRELEQEGVIVTHHGKGSAVAPETNLGTRIFEEDLQRLLGEVVRLGRALGCTPEDLASRLRRAAELAEEGP